MIKWLTIAKFAAESGYTEKAIRKKMEDGFWKEGVIWKKAPDNRILINTEEFEKWVEEEAVLRKPQPAASKSRSSSTASAAGNASRCLLRPLT